MQIKTALQSEFLKYSASLALREAHLLRDFSKI